MWLNPLPRSSWQFLCSLVVLQCIGCGSETVPSSDDAVQVDSQDQQVAAGESATPTASTKSSQPSAEDDTATVDWARFTQPGDVTQEILPYFRNRSLDLGETKISASDDVKLVKAEIASGKLLLTLRMNKPKQHVRFEGMPGAMGSYFPKGQRVRPVLIRGESHRERFVRGGVLRVGVSHPHPDQIQVAATKPPSQKEIFQQALAMREETRRKAAEARKRQPPAGPVARKPKSAKKPAPLLPGPESGYKPRDEAFARLAAAVSGKYKMPGRNTHRDYKVQWREAAHAGANYPALGVQKYAQAMLAGAKAVREINVAAVRASLLKEAAQVEGRIASGEFTRRQGSRENGVVEFKTVDESGSARSRAQYLRSVAAKNDADLKKWQTTQLQTNGWADLFGSGISKNPDHQFQNLVIEAQKALIEEAAKHAGRKSNSSLVQVTRPNSSLIKIGNASGKRLTDVILDLGVGFTRSDKRKAYGAPLLLFVPVWKPNEQLELEFQLKDPRVMHFLANVYANEASSKDHKTTLIDPNSLPDNRPGTIVLQSNDPLGEKEVAWAEVDGKRHDWEAGKNLLKIPAEPGEHNVVVKRRVKNRDKEVYQQRLTIEAGQLRTFPITSTIVIYSNDTLGPKGRAWAEVDGERHDWEVGKNRLTLMVVPGEHTVVVKARVGRRMKDVYKEELKVHAGQNLRVRLATGR